MNELSTAEYLPHAVEIGSEIDWEVREVEENVGF